jgi:hypothetical protein
MSGINTKDNFIEESIYELTLKMTEECDRFVFSVISDWFFRDYGYIISKELIMQALIYFKENESEAYKILSEKVLDKNKGV